MNILSVIATAIGVIPNIFNRVVLKNEKEAEAHNRIIAWFTMMFAFIVISCGVNSIVNKVDFVTCVEKLCSITSSQSGAFKGAVDGQDH